MLCYNPTVAIETTLGEWTDQKTGEYWPNKKEVKIISQDRIMELWEKEKIQKNLLPNQRILEFGCGKCDGCKQNDKYIWATRCYLESIEYPYNYMITLTYDDEHAPKGEKGRMTLKMKDFQDFMKRLRIEWQRRHGHGYKKDEEGNVIDYGIRYKMCSEYGSEEKTMRPHYHFIGFNLPIFDLERFFLSETDGQVYKSAELSEIWGLGYVTVIECNWNTCSYVSGYVMKKATSTDEKKDYEALGILPEFSLQSTRPGIGYKYFEKNWEKIYKTDSIFIKKKSKKDNWRTVSQEVKPPRYFDKCLQKINPDLLEEVKKKRSELAEDNEKLLMSKTTMTRKEYLQNKERKHKEALKLIKRRKMKNVS